ncbi:hypothetical protein AAV35_002545 [Salimicrobium jeotgali]|uniref:O-antigen ligase n=1 Tax=Salimicrobium jeotgali TaxID=1230341 RepID=K2H647_9BACI|nr:oligosaccharide repeat unit polymerase [Salimicrobium jeotgali]AKG03777.1 hypothetical protein AAV35_002545 [Salimicrobium jeotgali]EKE31260.1 O-antigen ligase [Salimicrobium jeotgali]MBM7697072.1 ABC-type cobalt transport system substrate-binding protein [Salimicrobium jeotgali]
MKMIKKNTNNINSLLLAVFLLLSSVTLPLNQFFENGIAVWFFTIIIVITSLVVNGFRVNFQGVIILLIMFLLLGINYFFVSYKAYVFPIVMDFIKLGGVAFYLATCRLDMRVFIKAWAWISVLSMMFWFLYLNEVISGNISYMFFGTQTTIMVIGFLLYHFSIKKNTFFIIFSIVGAGLVVTLGNRSSLLIIVIIYLMLLIYSFKKDSFIKSYFKGISFILLMLLATLNAEKILILVNERLLAMDIHSYSLNKLILAFDNGIVETSSGREELLGLGYEIAKSNNFMPKGVGYFQYITEGNYPHNIFIDVLVSFGFFGVILLLVLFGLGVYQYKKMNNELLKLITLAFFVFVFIRLNFSSTFWISTEFWILLGLVFTPKQALNKNGNIHQKF